MENEQWEKAEGGEVVRYEEDTDTLELGIEERDYALNKRKALEKKLITTRRDDVVVLKTGGGIKFLLNSGMYELFKNSIDEFYTSSDMKDTCQKIPVHDKQGNLVETKYKVLSGRQGVYTINMYHTKSSCMVNGKQSKQFTEVDFPEILQSIKMKEDIHGITVSQVNEYMQQLLIKCSAATAEIPLSNVSKMHEEELKSLHDTVENVRRLKHTKPSVNTDTGESNVCEHRDFTVLETLLANLSADINMQFNAINERMDELEASLEKRIVQKVTQVIDKRVNIEMNKIRMCVEEQISSVKSDIAAEFRTDFEEVNDKIQRVTVKMAEAGGTDNHALNIVVRDLAEHENENVLNKVNKLIKDGLKISDVVCESAVRKGQNAQKSRVVIARFKSFEDKRKIMTQKKKLKDNLQYRDVFIHHDQPLAERVMADNFRTVLNALKQHGLAMRGSRVVQMGSTGEDPRQRGQRTQGHENSDRDSVNNVQNMHRGSPRGDLGVSGRRAQNSRDNMRRDSHSESSYEGSHSMSQNRNNDGSAYFGSRGTNYTPVRRRGTSHRGRNRRVTNNQSPFY